MLCPKHQCMADAFSHSAGYYPGPPASQIMTHRQERLLVENNPRDSFKQLSEFPSSWGVCGRGRREWGWEEPRVLGCFTQNPLLCAYAPTRRQSVEALGAKGRIWGKSHFLTLWWGTDESKWTGRVTSAFPSHAPTPVLYEESLKQIAELSSISLAITVYTQRFTETSTGPRWNWSKTKDGTSS